MPRPTRFRPVLPVVLPLLTAGCLSATGDLPGGGRPASCGVRAAMDTRLPERFRNSPPACSLPTARTVATACAIRDRITSPDYRAPSYTEEGVEIGGRPLPEYQVSGLRCRYSSRDRNEAACRFDLSRPGSGTTATTAAFEHRFVQDHGPAHHLYDVWWFARDNCVPEAMVQSRSGI